MRTIRFLLVKEFKQIFRNRSILVMIIGMPVIQLMILPLAANYEVKNINIVIVNQDHSPVSAKLVSKINASTYLNVLSHLTSYDQALKLAEDDKTDLILQIPPHFEKNLIRDNQQKLFIAVNAINGMKAGLGYGYLSNIIQMFNEELRGQMMPRSKFNVAQEIELEFTSRFNPHQVYYLFMVPGILAFLVTMITGFLSALNIVKEKEMGTIEQINVTPIKKYHFILGKLIPFWIIGTVVFTLGLMVSFFVYGIVPAGSILLLYGFMWVYLLAVLGFGLLVSTYCDKQQQAMLIMFFFMMIFILMGGLLTSIDGMPYWAKMIAALNPVSYIIDVVRAVVLKGSGLQDILPQLGTIIVFAIVLNSWAIYNYKKTN
ncbi:ABC transporter permease [Pedobacter ginsengisoli]|uniref:ABC transporter permease n=1 Tax=Pedobacter ginsengisoli TaxID=363852 RepID=UPI00254C3257|nr:ABC transporter permease [Pedobacter ginsengisoli]